MNKGKVITESFLNSVCLWTVVVEVSLEDKWKYKTRALKALTTDVWV